MQKGDEHSLEFHEVYQEYLSTFEGKIEGKSSSRATVLGGGGTFVWSSPYYPWPFSLFVASCWCCVDSSSVVCRCLGCMLLGWSLLGDCTLVFGCQPLSSPALQLGTPVSWYDSMQALCHVESVVVDVLVCPALPYPEFHVLDPDPHLFDQCSVPPLHDS